MKYSKQAIGIDEQIFRLGERGLIINEPERAKHYLSNISFYRLRAYTYPFQDNENPAHPFVRKVTFDDIIKLYRFDRQLRLVVLNAIEKIEVAFRTQIIHQYAILYGSHWHLRPELYTDASLFADQIASLNKEIQRSKESFITHYKAKYSTPSDPPCWMSLEVTSLGVLSKIFANLKNDETKTRIANHFGLKDVDLLENWLRCFCVIRNISAHHSRLWNRRMTKIGIPRKPLHPFVSIELFRTNKVYAYLSAMQYILNIISPGHHFRHCLLELMDSCPLAQEHDMGFPKNWKEEQFWNA